MTPALLLPLSTCPHTRTDPWYCLPYGIGITGEALPGYPTSSGTAEACAYACQTTPTCSAYLHSPDSATASCTLFRKVFNGPDGTAALLADGRARACLKTPQFSHPTGSVPFWSHMCYTGVDLGGTVVSTLSNVDGHECAKWCAAYGYGCSHWQLSTAGVCEARTGPLWTNAGGMVVYGPQSGIATACLRSTGGSGSPARGFGPRTYVRYGIRARLCWLLTWHPLRSAPYDCSGQQVPLCACATALK